MVATDAGGSWPVDPTWIWLTKRTRKPGMVKRLNLMGYRLSNVQVSPAFKRFKEVGDRKPFG